MRNAVNRIWVFGLLLSVTLLSSFLSEAAPMEGERIVFVQPEGTVLHLKVYGDEFYAETRTMGGYTVFFDLPVRAYFYAALSADGSELVSSGILVEKSKPPRKLVKKLTINPASKRLIIDRKVVAMEHETHQEERWIALKNKSLSLKTHAMKAPPAETTKGLRIGLTILIDFPDEPGTITQQEVDNYCNQSGYSGSGNAGSVFDFFQTQSDGALRYYNVVTPYIMMSHPKSYYNDLGKEAGDCGRLLLNDALQKLMDVHFDFSVCTTNANGRLHAVNAFFTGNNSGREGWGLWPHKWGLEPDVELGNGTYADLYQISDMGDGLKLGTFCHENGHLICDFPDLYDYHFDSKGNGKFDIMSSIGDQLHPTSFGAYLRYHAGWPEIKTITTNTHQRCAVRVDTGSLYSFQNPLRTDEFFLIQNREKIGWEKDSWLPDQGLLIAHCDNAGNRDSQYMTEAYHYESSIEQADGLFHLEKNMNYGGVNDLFHSGNKTDFNDATLPNARWWKNATSDPSSGDASGLFIHSISVLGETMTFIAGEGALTNAPAIGSDRTLLQPRAFYGASPLDDRFAIWNQQGGTLVCSVTSLVSWIECSTNISVTTESAVIHLAYNTVGLAAGTHVGQIQITNTNESTNIETLQIKLTIEEQPMLSATPATLTATSVAGYSAAPLLLMLGNNGGSSLSYTFTNAPAWCDAPQSGNLSQGADCLEIIFDAANLSAGSYTGSLTIQSPEALNSPKTIALSFHVKDLSFIPFESDVYTNQQTLGIQWQFATNVYEFVRIEFWKNDTFEALLAAQTKNDGAFDWIIPAHIPNATNYTLRIAGHGSSSEIISEPFAIYYHYASFENELDGGWVNATDDDTDWSIIAGRTPSSYTGPDTASDQQHYLFAEASSHNNQTVVLTNHFNPNPARLLQLQFDYHMYGSSMGSLHLDLSDGQTWSSNVWEKIGQQHASYEDPWSTATINLSPWCGNTNLTLRIRGIIGSGYKSDMAIDHIRIIDTTSYHYLTITGTNGYSTPTSQWVKVGTEQIITALADPYYSFSNWTGDASGTNHSVTLTMDSPKTITAHFSENQLINGVPEWWLAAYGIGITDADALLDTDTDRLQNWEEFYAGTNPTNPASALILNPLQSLEDHFIISWQSVVGKTYSVLHTTNLLNFSWNTNAAGIQGHAPITSYTNAPSTASGYFRILLEK